MSGRAVEAAGDCSTLLLDKTGTITLGNRQATEFLPLPGVDERELADAAQLSSLADETPGGSLDRRARRRSATACASASCTTATLVPFTAQTRMSGVDLDGTRDPQGARRRRSRRCVEAAGRHRPRRARRHRRRDRPRGRHAARRRARTASALGVVHLEGRRQEGISERFDAAARDGHPHGDDHRRQPADRGGDRRRGRRRRLPRRGDARGQDGADQARAGGRQARRDDRRRHERRAGARRRPTSAWR